MAHCYVCGHEPLSEVFDAGLQPIGNRFLTSAEGNGEERLYPMRLDQCVRCGLLQMPEPVPARELIPPYDWVTYSEPEDHLDELADVIRALPGIGPASLAGGVSFKDDTTLRRLAERGIGRTWRLDIREDLDRPDAHGGYGAETIQIQLTPDRAARIAAARGPADVLLVRHIAEHAHDPKRFFQALIDLTTPNGYVVLEVPDCQRALDTGDCTTLWEEHTMYFTPGTFEQTLRVLGLEPVFVKNYVYPFENSLVAVVGRGTPSAPDAAVADTERRRNEAFAARLRERRTRLRDYLTEYRRGGGRVALFGAGHLACTFLTVMDLADAVEFVVDDNPNKRGLYMPGSRVPIVASSALLEHDVRLCLLSLNPLSEGKVMERQRAFVERGGTFKSIFPASSVALPL